jgi:hypothetical protein
MKHLKKFEGCDYGYSRNSFDKLKYKVGDYVRLKAIYDAQSRFAKIVEIEDKDGTAETPYKVLFETGEYMWIHIYAIDYELRPKEIIQYEINFARNKFNI